MAILEYIIQICRQLWPILTVCLQHFAETVQMTERGIKKLKTPKAEKTDTRRVLKTAIYYDPCGSMSQTTEEQIAADVKHFNGQYGPFDGKFTLKPYQIHDTRGIQPGTDLVLFDYGGMGFGNDLMR